MEGMPIIKWPFVLYKMFMLMLIPYNLLIINKITNRRVYS